MTDPLAVDRNGTRSLDENDAAGGTGARILIIEDEGLVAQTLVDLVTDAVSSRLAPLQLQPRQWGFSTRGIRTLQFSISC